MCSKGGATDNHGRKIQLYKDVRKIISELHDAGIKVAAASRYMCTCVHAHAWHSPTCTNAVHFY